MNFYPLNWGAIPHTREANEIIKKWITEKMRVGEIAGIYDPEAPYSFSIWLKKTILWELIDQKTKTKWWKNNDREETH
jgi:hypothetical protein